MIYEATVTTTTGDTKTYIGMTEHEFKTRYNNHKLSFRDRKHSHSTVLSKHIWDLKDSNTDYQINWRIIKGQMHTGETLPVGTCVCLRNSASCPLVTFPSSTRNLSWSLTVVMRTSSSQQPIRTGAVLKLSHMYTQSDDRLVRETRVTITFYL